MKYNIEQYSPIWYYTTAYFQYVTMVHGSSFVDKISIFIIFLYIIVNRTYKQIYTKEIESFMNVYKSQYL